MTLGTDAGTGAMGIVSIFLVHEVLRIMTENGFTPYEAIRTATVNASRVAAEMTGKEDFSFWLIGNDFWIQLPGSPKEGTYKFTVTSGNRQGSGIDTQSIIRPIPLPVIGALSPADR